MFRIGCGAGFSADRLEPALALAEHGQLNFIVFECIGERTLAFGQRDRRRDPSAGYNALLKQRMRAVLPVCAKSGTRIMTNMGVANPRAAAEATIPIARELGLTGLRVAYVEGDDVAALLPPDTGLWEGGTIADVELPVVGANVYLGTDALLPAVESGADVIITGRVADPSLFLAPMVAYYGWAEDDWPRLGAGILVGHLLECSSQITGGYFADPGYKEVPNLAYVGYPYAEVAADGTAVVCKLPDAGGMVSIATVKEQMLYEVHDPSRYFVPEVTADFSRVQLREDGHDRVAISNASGTRRPDLLKVTVGFDGGFLADGGISYAGPNALARAKLARHIIAERMTNLHGIKDQMRLDIIGLDSLHGTAVDRPSNSQDVRFRGALRSSSRDVAELFLWEIEALFTSGPAGGGGYRGSITPTVVTHSASIERKLVSTSLTILTV